ncbi:MAG: shikimate dehydrogenase [Eubacterium sp.]|nr:shikimate dehydrogenase [Eubacterium sp.]
MKTTDGKTGLYALFADPVEHSLSPLMHNTAFNIKSINAVYMAFRVTKDNMADAVKAMKVLNIAGANISMPNKKEVMNYLDVVTDEALFCNAVNTVVNRDGKLYGYNTDIYGAQKAIESLDIEIYDKEFTLLGLGGAGQAVLYALAKNKARKVNVFIRNESFDKRRDFIKKINDKFSTDCSIYPFNSCEQIKKSLENSILLINATCVGMGKYEGQSPLAEDINLPKKISVFDLIYAPSETRLTAKAKNEKCRAVINGLPMLVNQGAMAFKLFTGEEMPTEYIAEHLKRFDKM